MTVPPAIQISPSACVTCTRPARPSAVPWWARYGVVDAPALEQPAGERGVQRAGDRVLGGRAVLREERPHLEHAVVMEPGHAHVEVDVPGPQRQHLLGGRAAAPPPTRARCPPTRRRRCPSARSPARDATCATSDSSTGPLRSSGGAANASPCSVRRISISPAPHSCTTRSRLTAARARRGRCRASDARRTAARRSGVKIRSAVVGGLGGQHERRLGQVRPVREALHLLGGEPVAVEHDGDGVPAIGRRREDVDLGEGARHALLLQPLERLGHVAVADRLVADDRDRRRERRARAGRRATLAPGRGEQHGEREDRGRAAPAGAGGTGRACASAARRARRSRG